MSSEKNPINMQCNLLWEDLLYLNRQKFCLRTVNDKETAKMEQTQGGRGDAISLAAFGYPRAACAGDIYLFLKERNLIPAVNIEDSYPLVISWLSSPHSDLVMSNFPQAKSELAKRVNDGILEHVQKAFCCSEKPAFVLLSCEIADLVYDLDRYILGKLGKQSFTSQQVKTVIGESNTGVWNPETACHAIITEIKRLASQPTHTENYQPIFQTPTSPDVSDSSHVEKSDKNLNANKSDEINCSLF
jgi:hypothetical protein